MTGMKITRRYTGKTRIEMIPLIDVIFLLLVTFIFFTISMTFNRGIPVELPSSSTATIEEKGFADITVRKDGKIFFNKHEVTPALLLSRMKNLRRKSPEIKIIVSGERDASYEDVVSVLDIVRKSGMNGVSLETKWK
jgi:biopolymer transport protein ExbD